MGGSSDAHAAGRVTAIGTVLALGLLSGLVATPSALGTAHAEQALDQQTIATRAEPAHNQLVLAELAGAARTLSVDDTGNLHLLKAFGSVLLEEGHAGGTLPGQANVRMTVGPTVTASFAIKARYGTIYGSGRAILHSSARYSSFAGTLLVSHGTGSYADAHGGGKLYGVIDRRTSALTVQTVGTLRY